MKRHITYVLEADDLDKLCHREAAPLEIDVEDADSVSITTNAYPELMDSAGGFRFVTEKELVTDGGETPEATDEDVDEAVWDDPQIPSLDFESIDVTLEQSLTREGDEEIVRWTATADNVDVTLGSDTPAGALRSLADELEVNGGEN